MPVSLSHMRDILLPCLRDLNLKYDLDADLNILIDTAIKRGLVHHRLEPTFSLSELEEAQKLIDELS